MNIYVQLSANTSVSSMYRMSFVDMIKYIIAKQDVISLPGSTNAELASIDTELARRFWGFWVIAFPNLTLHVLIF